MFMNNNNTNEHPRRLRPHKPELRGPTMCKGGQFNIYLKKSEEASVTV